LHFVNSALAIELISVHSELSQIPEIASTTRNAGNLQLEARDKERLISSFGMSADSFPYEPTSDNNLVSMVITLAA
jgi:hypothetical protein